MNNAIGLAVILVRFKVKVGVGATGIRRAFPKTVNAAAIAICRTCFRFQHAGMVRCVGKENSKEDGKCDESLNIRRSE